MSDATPSFRELLDWAEGRVEEPRRSEIAALAAHDTETAASLEWIRSFHAASRLMPLATPPAERRAALRRTIDEYVRPWAPEHYSDGTLALASGGAGTARGTRGAGADTTLADLVFDTEIGRLRVTALPGRDQGIDVRITMDEAAASALRAGEPRVLFTAGERVRRTAHRVAPAEFEAADVPTDTDLIWVAHARWHLRLRPPGGWLGT